MPDSGENRIISNGIINHIGKIIQKGFLFHVIEIFQFGLNFNNQKLSSTSHNIEIDNFIKESGILRNIKINLFEGGHIGSLMARVAIAFDMKVIAWSQNLTPERAAECGATYVDKDTLFQDSDIVSIHVRLSDRTKGLEKRLQERAEKESKDIESILLELKRAIESELHEPEYRQMELFSDPEKDQFERNKDFLRNRVTQIPQEIKRETEAIRERYLDPQARMFPVAVTFLVPQNMAIQ